MGGVEWSNETTGQFINLQSFTDAFWRKDSLLPDWATIQETLPRLVHPSGAPAKRLFITHRWDSADHPDPSGWQLRALLNLGVHYNYSDRDYCFWYDYMSLPQRPKTKEEKRIFKSGLNNIRKIVAECQNICLISQIGESHEEDVAAMRLRGWIVFELFIRRNLGQRPLPIYEREQGNVNFGRSRLDWNHVVPNISTLAPLDTPDLLFAWLRNRGITCTNGSDLRRLASFLHEELTKISKFDETVEVQYDEPIKLSADQLTRFQFDVGSNTSARFPELFLEIQDYEPGTADYTVILRRRPPLPEVGVDLSLTKAELDAMAVDSLKGTSPMYPGIRFVSGPGVGVVRLEVM